MNDYVQDRKKYVAQIRRSFQDTEREDYENEPSAGGSASFIKLRFMIAVCIFAAFLLCDRTGSRFYNYTTEEFCALLQENRFEPQLAAVREAWNSIQSK